MISAAAVRESVTCCAAVTGSTLTSLRFGSLAGVTLPRTVTGYVASPTARSFPTVGSAGTPTELASIFRGLFQRVLVHHVANRDEAPNPVLNVRFDLLRRSTPTEPHFTAKFFIVANLHLLHDADHCLRIVRVEKTQSALGAGEVDGPRRVVEDFVSKPPRDRELGRDGDRETVLVAAFRLVAIVGGVLPGLVVLGVLVIVDRLAGGFLPFVLGLAERARRDFLRRQNFFLSLGDGNHFENFKLAHQHREFVPELANFFRLAFHLLLPSTVTRRGAWTADFFPSPPAVSSPSDSLPSSTVSFGPLSTTGGFAPTLMSRSRPSAIFFSSASCSRTSSTSPPWSEIAASREVRPAPMPRIVACTSLSGSTHIHPRASHFPSRKRLGSRESRTSEPESSASESQSSKIGCMNCSFIIDCSIFH